ncbi:MAG TPA: hypothetical protein VFF70_12670 [Anaerolineae bacterium]|nr:hypothetical protein [Anaerolineae bacterium]
MAKAKNKSVFMAGKAEWLSKNARQLAPEQRALLLAVARLDVESGHKLTAEEQAALDELSANSDGFDPKEIQDAVHHMVEAKTKRKTIDWPSGLYRLLRKKK